MSSMTGQSGFANTRSGNKAPSGYRERQAFTPEAMELYKRMFSQVSPDSYLSRLAGGDEDLFNEMEAPALRQFSELQGDIASRFSAGGGGRGSLSARKSSGFQNTMNSAASNFAQDLQSRRQDLMRQAIQDLSGMSHSLLNEEPYQLYEKRQKKKSGWGGLAGAGVGALGGFLAGGPAGSLSGGKLGYNIGSGF